MVTPPPPACFKGCALCWMRISERGRTSRVCVWGGLIRRYVGRGGGGGAGLASMTNSSTGGGGYRSSCTARCATSTSSAPVTRMKVWLPAGDHVRGNTRARRSNGPTTKTVGGWRRMASDASNNHLPAPQIKLHNSTQNPGRPTGPM